MSCIYTFNLTMISNDNNDAPRCIVCNNYGFCAGCAIIPVHFPSLGAVASINQRRQWSLKAIRASSYALRLCSVLSVHCGDKQPRTLHIDWCVRQDGHRIVYLHAAH